MAVDSVLLKRAVRNIAGHHSQPTVGGSTPQPAAPKAAPRAPVAARPGAAPKPNVQPAVRRYTGLMAAPLNELSDAEQRAHDIAARRQSDAGQYAAFVMGQQGSIQAAAVANDERALAQTHAIQTAGAGANASGLAALQRAREAQGIGGAVPSQQLGGVVDEQSRNNLLFASAAQRQADTTNTNRGKADFLKAAAQAQLMANQRGIAGDEFNQTSEIRREKVGLLGQRDQIAAETEAQVAAAAEKARADITEARIRASENAANRSSREGIASENAQLRRDLNESDQAFAARQKRADRRVRLKTSKIAAEAMPGYTDPKEARRRATAVASTESMRDQAVSLARNAAAAGVEPGKIRGYVIGKLKGKAPVEVVDYALANVLRSKAGVTKKGQPSAAARYYAYLKRVRRGEVG